MAEERRINPYLRFNQDAIIEILKKIIFPVPRNGNAGILDVHRIDLSSATYWLTHAYNSFMIRLCILLLRNILKNPQRAERMDEGN